MSTSAEARKPELLLNRVFDAPRELVKRSVDRSGIALLSSGLARTDSQIRSVSWTFGPAAGGAT